ncbi:MAG TPA: ABC transporter permease [Candidatus Paceibacterota bacterium]|nr:ABC transporter permease [Verrucomicrobiota bacterium]HSA10100.1 ABC transporter permease [Candidatus Paceibacterota bacterium]
MRAYGTLVRRELAGFFLSLGGYVIIAAALFMMGYSFIVIFAKLQKPSPMPVTELFYITPFFWLILLLTTPVITMRLFALEKFSGTYETLMTAPVSDFQVVMAKFTAALLFYAVMWLPLLGCLLLVRHYTSDAAALDAGVASGMFLGLLLLGGVFISLGCFASALTRSQGIAAMLSLVFGASLFLLGYLASQLPASESWQGQVLGCFALFEQMHDFARGIVDTRPVMLLASLTVFFLFLTLRVVESRRWK